MDNESTTGRSNQKMSNINGGKPKIFFAIYL